MALRADPNLAARGARGDHTKSEFVFVRVVTSDGIAGFGEVSATPYWSGEDSVTAEHFIRELIAPAIVGQPLAPVQAITALVEKLLARNSFTKAGINMAIWDALGKTLGLPVASLLGGALRQRVPIKVSISGDGDDLAASIERARKLGFEAYKVKVGMGVTADVERFRLARELAGPDAFLGMDANGGWSRAEADHVLARVRAFAPAFVEQPLAPNDLDGTRRLRKTGFWIIIDEAVYGPGDLVNAIRADAADAVSIYIGKSGSLETALEMTRLAERFGLDSIIGSNGEMGIGAAAQLQIACACPSLGRVPFDIIGHLYYGKDLLAAPLTIDGAYAELPHGPGLGVEPAPEVVRQFR